jgi:hypothetical protein
MIIDKLHQMVMLSINFLFISMKHEISATIHFNVSRQANKQLTSDGKTANHRTIGITCHLELYAAGYISSRKCKLTVSQSSLSCWVPSIPQDFPLFLIIVLIFSPIARRDSKTPYPGVIESEWSQTTDASSNAPIAETLQL